MADSTDRRLYDLIERLGTLLHDRARAPDDDPADDLQPVHVRILAYLDACNRYSDTPAAVTAYLGLTKGTVSQSLSLLHRRGLIDKTPDPDDRRVVHLALRPAGRDALAAHVPPATFRDACAQLPAGDRAALAAQLDGLLRAMQQTTGRSGFGLCHTCRLFRREPDGFRCGLTLEPLSPADSEKICREHETPTTSGAGAAHDDV
ncbi:MAG: MarR family winged helix-turn-helix transcriptional regulator [Acidobacteriota bacterium]